MPNTRNDNSPKDQLKYFADHWFFKIIAIPFFGWLIPAVYTMTTDIAVMKAQIGYISQALGEIRSDIKTGKSAEYDGARSNNLTPSVPATQTDILPSLYRRFQRKPYYR